MSARPKRRGKVILPNDTVYDAELSYRALGLLAAMLARPANASFDMREFAADPTRRSGREGRSGLLTAVQELRDRGYVWTFRVTLGGRKGVRTETVVSAEPMSEDDALAVVKARCGTDLQRSENQTPVYRTTVNRTPAQSTPLPTEGHTPSSLRSGEKSIAGQRECCDSLGFVQLDDNTVAKCPEHHPHLRSA